MKEFTVVRYTSESKPKWGLVQGKLYAVETNEDYVMLFDGGTITVWNDEGHLAEMNQGEYQVVITDKKEWFKVRPERIYLEVY